MKIHVYTHSQVDEVNEKLQEAILMENGIRVFEDKIVLVESEREGFPKKDQLERLDVTLATLKRERLDEEGHHRIVKNRADKKLGGTEKQRAVQAELTASKEHLADIDEKIRITQER